MVMVSRVQPGSQRFVRGSNPIFVLQQRQAAVARQNNIQESVAIDVANGASSPVSVKLRQSRRVGDVFESTVSKVAIEYGMRRGDQQDVHPAVVVIVEEGAAAPKRFEDAH